MNQVTHEWKNKIAIKEYLPFNLQLHNIWKEIFFPTFMKMKMKESALKNGDWSFLPKPTHWMILHNAMQCKVGSRIYNAVYKNVTIYGFKCIEIQIVSVSPCRIYTGCPKTSGQK